MTPGWVDRMVCAHARITNLHRGSLSVPVLTMTFSYPERMLYTADERGEVKIWHLSGLLENASMTEQISQKQRITTKQTARVNLAVPVGTPTWELSEKLLQRSEELTSTSRRRSRGGTGGCASGLQVQSPRRVRHQVRPSTASHPPVAGLSHDGT